MTSSVPHASEFVHHSDLQSVISTLSLDFCARFFLCGECLQLIRADLVCYHLFNLPKMMLALLNLPLELSCHIACLNCGNATAVIELIIEVPILSIQSSRPNDISHNTPKMSIQLLDTFRSKLWSPLGCASGTKWV